MPGFIPDAEQVPMRIAQCEIAVLKKLVVDLGLCELLSKVPYAKAALSHVEISDTVKRISGRSKRP